MSKGILWGVIQSPLIIPSRYSQSQPHHVTLQFRVDCDDWKQWEGLELQTTALYEAWNGNIQAVALIYSDRSPELLSSAIAKVQAVKITCTLAVGDSSQNLIIY
jgi:hypothetical protein